MVTRKRGTRHTQIKEPHKQFADFVEKYVPSDGERVSADALSRFPQGTQVGDIINPDMGVTFGYWVHPERYRNHMRLLLKSLDLKKDSKVLSIGIDGGLFEIFLAKHVIPEGKITTFLPDERNLKIARQIAKREGVLSRMDFKLLEGERLGRARSGHYDAAMSIAVLHTRPEHMDIISQFQRILKPNARALLTYSPPYLKSKFGTDHRALKGHVRRHFSIERDGVALSPDAAYGFYGGLELERRRERGYGISQRYLVLKPHSKAV